MPLDAFHVPSRLARTVRADRFTVVCNRDFEGVIDGCSELMIEVFGGAGWGARSAIGVAELPVGIAVEIEAVVQVAPAEADTP